MQKKYWLILILLNLFIAVGFFIENKGTGFTQLSSDLHNSIPVCYKLDNPSLFQKDMYLYDVKNVKYYTPFYIQTVRFFAWCANGDYLLGINIFATILHLIYGLSWFFLFYKIFRRFALALFLSVLIRGIVWLPGMEIWGISDLWTMMPRTMYAAFMPIPFLLLLNRTKRSFFLAAFLIGLIFNFHPITGMGGLLIFLLFIGIYCYQHSIKIPFSTMAIAAGLAILGMLPFLSTYFTQTESNVVYDVAIYKKAFFTRIPEFFAHPLEFLKLWMKGSTLFFLIPLLVFYVYARLKDRSYLKPAGLLLAITFFTVLIPSISVYIENAVNAALHLNLRMSFQIIRAQKLAILPGYFAIGFLIGIALEKIPVLVKPFRIGVLLFVIALFFCKSTFLGNVPFFKDDIATSIFPEYRQFFQTREEKQSSLDCMLTYIDKNTLPTDVFWGAYIIRCGCKRSVVLDGKGASMLIEGNPVEFIKWYQENLQLKALDGDEKIAFLKNVKSVTHIFSNVKLSGKVTLLHTEGIYYLYKIQ